MSRLTILERYRSALDHVPGAMLGDGHEQQWTESALRRTSSSVAMNVTLSWSFPR